MKMLLFLRFHISDSITFVGRSPGYFTCPAAKSSFEDNHVYWSLVKPHRQGETEVLGEKTAHFSLIQNKT
jgi:hypothetical protein